MSRPSIDQILLRLKSLEKSGDLAAAHALCQQMLAIWPANSRLQAAAARLGPPPHPTAEQFAQLRRLFEAGNHTAVLTQGSALARAHPRSHSLCNILAAAATRLGRPQLAATWYQRALQIDPGFAEAHHNLGSLMLIEARWREAADSFGRAVALHPTPDALSGLASAEYRLGLDDLAQQHFQQAVQVAPLHGPALLGLARVLTRQAQYDRALLDQALAAAETAAKIAPDSADLHLLLGRIHGFRGDIAASERAYLRAMGGPHGATACRELTETHRFTAGDPLIPRIVAMVGGTPADRCHLGFARFKLHHDLGQPAEAFAALAEANRLRRAALRYDPAQDQQQFAALTLAAPSLGRHTLTPAAASPRPIFILGMPRSGSSLVEQILSSHSAVAGGGELPFLGRLRLDLATGKQAVSVGALQQLRLDYLIRIQPLAKGKAHVTDKMPHNFRLIPLIRAALPEALIVHVHRDPAAVCWSNYKHYFASPGLGYCHDLADITRFHALYRGLMQRWSDLYGARIIQLDYDALTRDPATRTRALLADLGLPWQDACLTPQDNPRVVRTVSQMQVRQPIYAGSSDDWQQYQPYLGGAFDSLT